MLTKKGKNLRKKMEKWHIKNSKKLKIPEISEKLFWVNQKLGFKNLEKNF